MSASAFLSPPMLQFIAAYVMVMMVPGPVTLATGGLAVFQGFSKTIPLLAGIGVGRAMLTASMAFGAVHLGANLSLPVTRICGAAVLCAIAWRMARATPHEMNPSLKRVEGKLFVEGVAVGLLSPQTAAFYAAALVALMLETPAVGDAIALVTILPIITVGWHAMVAALFSHPSVRGAALRHHVVICRIAAATLCFMALSLALA